MLDSKQIAMVLYPLAWDNPPPENYDRNLDVIMSRLLTKGYDIEIKVVARDRDALGHPTRQGRMTLTIES